MTGTNQDRYPPVGLFGLSDKFVNAAAEHALRDPGYREALEKSTAERTARHVLARLQEMESDPSTQPRLHNTAGADVTDQFTWTRNPVGTGWIATAADVVEVDGRILNPGDLYGPVHAWERR